MEELSLRDLSSRVTRWEYGTVWSQSLLTFQSISKVQVGLEYRSLESAALYQIQHSNRGFLFPLDKMFTVLATFC